MACCSAASISTVSAGASLSTVSVVAIDGTKRRRSQAVTAARSPGAVITSCWETPGRTSSAPASSAASPPLPAQKQSERLPQWEDDLRPTEMPAQQVADSAFAPPVPQPAFAEGQGPVVLLDEAHFNFHTASGRYFTFAQLLRRDGFVVRPLTAPFSKASLAGARVLVTEIDPICALQAAMEGYQVVTMEDAAPAADIFVTATGNVHVINHDHMARMKDESIVCNSGHFNVELDIPALEKLAKKRKVVRDGVEQFTYKNGNRVSLLGEGRLVNLATAEGHPSSVMDMSFANQALAARGVKLSVGRPRFSVIR